MIKGQIIAGDFSRVYIRQKSNNNIEIGELLVTENNESRIILLVSDLSYKSQISDQNIEMISGLELEEESDYDIKDSNIRNYIIATAKALITYNKKTHQVMKPKTLPRRFTKVSEITKEDMAFLNKPESSIFVGKIRSGSKIIDIPINLNGKKVLSHHILLSATTGKGKSNLCSVMLWNLLEKNYCGMLILDPHDEYYGHDKLGLKDKNSEKLVYYSSKNIPVGEKTLKINIETIKPKHLRGILYWTDAQNQAILSYYKEFGLKWIENILLEKKVDGNYNEATISVLRRKLLNLLNLKLFNDKYIEDGIFSFHAGRSTIEDICYELENSRKVIINTSNFSGSVELLIGSLIATEIFTRYQKFKNAGIIEQKPIISIVLEEAPRVLGKEVLEKGSNIFEQIAREGRKFKIGLFAITQLPSLIPKVILANINTKIIMGTEMSQERQSLIESSYQDLSDYSKAIAALDTGEAIISTSFMNFPIPIKAPLFTDYKPFEKKKINHDYSDFNQ